MLEAGWAAAEGAFGLACAAHPRRHVVASRGHGTAHWQYARLIGQGAGVQWWVDCALVVVWARPRRGHDAWAVAWAGRRRAWPSCTPRRRVALSDGSYWFLAPNGCQLVRFGWLVRDNNASLGQNLQLCIGWQLVVCGSSMVWLYLLHTFYASVRRYIGTRVL